MAARQFYNQDSADISSIASTTYTTKASITFTPDANATYIIIASWAMRCSSASYQARGKLRRTSGTAADLNIQLYRPKDATNYIPCSAFYYETFGASPTSQTYEIQYSSSNAAATCYIKNASLIAIKCTANDKFNYVVTRTTYVATVNYTDKLSLTFTPPSEGDYLILACAVIDGSSTSYQTKARIDIDGTAQTCEGIVQPNQTANRFPWNGVYKTTLSAASHTIKVQFATSSVSGTAGCAYTTIIALRLSDWDSQYYNSSDTRNTTTNTAYQDHTSIADTLANAYWLFIGDGKFDGSSTSYDSKISMREGTTTIREINIEPSNANNRLSYFGSYVGLKSGAITPKLSYASENASGTTGLGLVRIAVLRLELNPILDQEGYRLRNDDGSETTATWIAAQDTTASIVFYDLPVNVRLRTLINETNGADAPSTQYQLECKKSTDSIFSKLLFDTTSVVVETFTDTGADTWTCPNGVTSVQVECWGGGGGGGSGDGFYAGAGGGGGAYSKSYSINVTNGNTYNYTVGAGGAGGAGGGQNDGSDGGITTFTGDSSVKCEAVGGQKGATYDITPPLFSSGGDSISCTGDICYSGGNGDGNNGANTNSGGGGEGAGTTSDGGDASLTTGGNGTDGGDGGNGVESSTPGNPGNITGGGGAGAGAGYSDNGGGAGARGQIKLTYIVSIPIYISDSTSISASGAATTAQLTAPSGKTTSDFVAGRIQDDENPADAVTITANKYTELEWNLSINEDAVTIGDIYQFRVTANGVALDSYTVTPTIRIIGYNDNKIYYRYEGATYTIETYDSYAGWDNKIAVRMHDGTRYIKLSVTLDHVNKSHIRVRVNDTTYAVLNEV